MTRPVNLRPSGCRRTGILATAVGLVVVLLPGLALGQVARATPAAPVEGTQAVPNLARTVAAALEPMRSLPEPSTRPLPRHGLRYAVAEGAAGGHGTVEAPWRSFGYALSELEPGDTLLLRGGVYQEAVVVTASGTPDQPITIRSHPGELAILDGGLAEFRTRPEAAWEPVPGGAPGEFRSRATFPGIRRAVGTFAASAVPLHGYVWLHDLRSNRSRPAEDEGLYCGPGLWFDPRSHRFHVRLAHDSADYFPEAHRYRGERDPRKVPMAVAAAQVTLELRGARHVRIQDLLVRGATRAAIELLDAEGIELDGVTAYAGYHAILLERTRDVEIVGSRFRGQSAPWSSRTCLKYHGNPGVLLRTAGPVRKNLDLEIVDSEFTDGHDGVFLGDAKEVDFHHNLVENFNDDGIFLTARGAPAGPVRIWANRISRCLTSFAFGWGSGDVNLPGAGVAIYRNLVEHTRPVYYSLPQEGAELPEHYGSLMRDHGSPTWEPMRIYHNDFVLRRPERHSYLSGLASHLAGTWRAVFNNLFVELVTSPRFPARAPAGDLRSDGNLFWSPTESDSEGSVRLDAYHAGPVFEATRAVYPPGLEAASAYGDPEFADFALGEEAGYRRAPSGAARDLGIELPEDWPDPLRPLDRGAPDAGALPVGDDVPLPGPRPPARDSVQEEAGAAGGR